MERHRERQLMTTALQDQIALRAKEIRTDGYGMSIGEVLSLYKDNDIDIHPEFQRIFRWKNSQKSRLIESILLGIPIPPIFVSQRADGVWDVIDGVQRLSTVLEFMGEYSDESGARQPQTALERGEYLTELEGYHFSDDTDGTGLVFDEVLRRDFKRAKLEFRIITKESDANAKYDLFQRLNSGSVLSPQEARNCLLVMIDRNRFFALALLAGSDAFTASVPLSDRQEEQAYRDELVLRFFCQVAYSGPARELPQEFGEYLTDWMRTSAETAAANFDESLFQRTFTLLRASTGEDTFRRFDGSRHIGPFSISSFEFITAGVAAHISEWEQRGSAALREKIQESWTFPAFQQNSGTGISSRRRMPRLVNASRNFFA
jgi:hypothetical protein